MIEFFNMGGYAAFVWPALGVSALVMATLYIQSYTSLRARQAELDALQGKGNNEAET
jgi:heme exporter protein D